VKDFVSVKIRSEEEPSFEIAETDPARCRRLLSRRDSSSKDSVIPTLAPTFDLGIFLGEGVFL
jgi:hypothetical protein